MTNGLKTETRAPRQAPAARVVCERARNGLTAESRILADSLERAFADGKFHGPAGTGKEFMTWTGADSGYEGTFGSNFVPLYAIAIERGVITPPDPEWWPENTTPSPPEGTTE